MSSAAEGLFLSEPETRMVRAAGRIRSQTLMVIRWLAILGQSLTVLLIYYGLGFPLPLAESFVVIGASALVNAVVFLAYPIAARLSDRAAAAHLAFDLVQLAALLFLTGGLINPFAILLLVPLAISSTTLTLRSTVILALLVFVVVSILALAHFPLPWPAPGLRLPELYEFAVWIALMLASVLVTAYAWRVATEARRLQGAVDEAQLALARARRLSALGALAAAAAHELGTPLGTITLIASELADDTPKDSPHAEDISLLASQARRCREILSRLAKRPEAAEGSEQFTQLPFPSLVETAASPHLKPGIAVEISQKGAGPTPVVKRAPEIVHGLGNLIENAIGFAHEKVLIEVSWTDIGLRVDVLDDGPGFNVDILSALGEPYTTTRPGKGMGLGVFIAKTLLESSGGTVTFYNRAGGGAGASVTWPRHLQETS